jgi:GNAT superfamily N-acetyltransferase
MGDLLVRLYELEDDWSFVQSQQEIGVTIRKPIGPEKHTLLEWIRSSFYPAWASEADVALSHVPQSCFIAIRDGAFIGFACYDGTALGFFGPMGVLEAHRRQGTGSALLLACMLDMKLKGYGYAIIGWAGAEAFYERYTGATPISRSDKSIYGTFVVGDSLNEIEDA